MNRCEWCNTDAEEAALRHEGPHASWCVHYRRVPRPPLLVTEFVPTPSNWIREYFEDPAGRAALDNPPRWLHEAALLYSQHAERAQRPTTDDAEIEPHLYAPSSQHAGDCKACGHVADSPLHIVEQIDSPMGTLDRWMTPGGWPVYRVKRKP